MHSGDPRRLIAAGASHTVLLRAHYTEPAFHTRSLRTSSSSPAREAHHPTECERIPPISECRDATLGTEYCQRGISLAKKARKNTNRGQQIFQNA